MPPRMCLRCLTRQSFLTPDRLSLLVRPAVSSHAFSTSPPVSKAGNPPKRSPPIGKKIKKRALGFAKRGRTQGGGSGQARKDPVAAKAQRRRIVLSNTNALEVQGLQELVTSNVLAGDAIGKVLALTNDSVDSLRALQAFDHTQQWGLFRKPSTLVTSHAVNLARRVGDTINDKSTYSEIITGDKGSGKSVLALQAMALALEKGWIVVHIPVAQELTLGHTSYAPLRQADGSTQYIQAEYTAQLLGRIAKANARVLSNMTISRRHNLPIPIQSNLSLGRLAELGAADRNIAWPIFTAFFSELIAPSTKTHPRPPLLLSLDGLAHASRLTGYLTPELARIHAHDLALVALFNALLSKRARLPNGGLVLGVDSGSNRPSVPALDYAIQASFERQQQQVRQLSARTEDVRTDEKREQLLDQHVRWLRWKYRQACDQPTWPIGLDLGPHAAPPSVSASLLGEAFSKDEQMRIEAQTLRHESCRSGGSGSDSSTINDSSAARQAEKASLPTPPPLLPSLSWLRRTAATSSITADPLYRAGNPMPAAEVKRMFQSPMEGYDARVMGLVLGTTGGGGGGNGVGGAGTAPVPVRHVGGLSRLETRSIMDYYARSGILRGRVDDGRVAEEWTLSGGGLMGLLEDSLVRMRV